MILEVRAHYNACHCQLLAAGVSFYALLSMVPMILLAMAIGSAVFKSSAEASAWVVRAITEAFPSAPAGEIAPRLVGALQIPQGHFVSGLGLLLLLVWSSSRLFDTLERAINVVWEGAPHHAVRARPRGYFRRNAVGILVLAIVGILAMGWVLAVLFLAYVAGVAQSAHGTTWNALRRVWPFLNWQVTAIAFWLVVLALYKILPRAKVPTRSAVLAALCAVLAWELSKWGFMLLVRSSGTLSVAYGSLASAVLLATWVYVSCSIVLGSAIVARIHEQRLELRKASG